MSYQRQIRNIGETIILGGISYRLEEVEGCGSSAVVYKASYRDALNTDALHYVFIKELYPLTADGSIYRKENGEIACTEDGKALMEYSRQRFFQGNSVNLQLLKKMPSVTSGNINSYEAFGTFYSILAVHGGKNLKELLVNEEKRYSLPEAAEIMKEILDALKVFHQNGLLHLDLSPDNILLVEGQAFLIDYNSTWSLEDVSRGDFPFSEKPGYSSPEIRLGSSRDIGRATDLYSAAAVFFHIIMRRSLREEEIIGTGLKRCFAGNPEIFRNVPRTAAVKTTQILLKGLHTLPRRRYQSVEEMQEDFDELIRRIEGKGVSHSALWESSSLAFRHTRQPESVYLEQNVREKQGTVLSQVTLMEKLADGESFLLTGPGGMGKTRLLLEIRKKCLAAYRGDMPVFLYISLREYQESGQDVHFIRRHVLKNLSFSSEQADYQDALHQLELLFERKSPLKRANVVFLLDGFNEAGDSLEKLLLEIEELSGKSGVGILLTDRSDAVMAYGLKSFRQISLSPLTEEQIGYVMTQEGVDLPEEEGLMHLLATPMLLFLYTGMFKKEQTEGKVEIPRTKEELIRLYLESFCRSVLHADVGDQGRQLTDQFILEHMLPEIALEMKGKRKSILTFDEICHVSDRSYRLLDDREFGYAFPEYRGKSRLMTKEIKDRSQWYDLAVNEKLTDRFGLLEKTENGYYELIHDNFLPVLAQTALHNRKIIHKKKYKAWVYKGCLVAAVCAALGGVVRFGIVRTGGEQQDIHVYSEEEKEQIEEAVKVLAASLGNWNIQMNFQREIVEAAGKTAILDHQSAEKEEQLARLIERKAETLDSCYTPSFSEEMKKELEKTGAETELFSIEIMEELCNRPKLLKAALKEAMTHIEETLCTEDSPYDTREKREGIVTSYAEYIEAETEYVSVLLASLLSELPQEQAEEIRNDLYQLDAFSGYYSGAGSIQKENLSSAAASAGEKLKYARRQMDQQGYKIEWETNP